MMISLKMMKRNVSIHREEITHYFPDLEEFEKYHRFIPFVLSINDLPSEDNLIQEQFINDFSVKCLVAILGLKLHSAIPMLQRWL